MAKDVRERHPDLPERLKRNDDHQARHDRKAKRDLKHRRIFPSS